ncbi:MAG: nitronate monooxygenase [Burkholderiaceae bacterium]|nr:nitronate monooxygenase [Burkholderiaceae bacterium]
MSLALPRIWLAPMGGEAACAPLVAAVCNAGGLGWLGGAYMAPAKLAQTVDAIRTLTPLPFGVNLFCPQPWVRDAAREAAFTAALAPFHAALGLPPPAVPVSCEEDFEAQLAVLRDRRVPWVGFTFGDPGAARVAALHAAGAEVVGTVTNVPEAVQLAASGCDAIVAQGAEAGAHRGSFLGPRDAGLVGTLALVPQVVDAVSVPVVAAGGIADARGVAAAQALGASAAAAGTAFLLADECPISPAYRAALETGQGHETVLTAAFSGRWARGLANRFTQATDALVARGELPDFPIPNAMTRPLRQAAGRAGDAGALSLWAGQALPLARRAPAAEIVRRLAAGWKDR